MNIRITLLSALLFIISCKNLLSQATVLQDYFGVTTQAGNPKEFTEYNGYLYFSAASDETGRELWRTDGTDTGTQLFLDIGEFTQSGNPRFLTLFNSLIYFVANNGVDGTQIWKTDGTPEGTTMVTNLSGADPANLIVYNGVLFFSNQAQFTGRELWKSDGTSSGTVLVKDIYPGTSSSMSSSSGGVFPNFTVFNNKLYFYCNDGSHGNELWESNGTGSGTVLVSDINPGSGSSFVSDLGPVILNGQLYFVATNALYGEELWKSDGTASGTQLVSDINSGVSSSSPASLTVMGSNIYFSANDGLVSRELWKSDGTAAGTVLVKDILVGTNGTGPANLFNENGTLYFSSSSTLGVELFKSDGTAAGTVLVKDIYSGVPSSEPKSFAVFNSHIYFQARSLNNGFELWRTDGTTAGTVLVKDISPGIGGSSPSNFRVFANKLLFVANEFGLVNQELWCTNGTTAGTVLLRDINMGNNSSEINRWIIDNDKLLFSAINVNNGRELFKSDGTVAGTGLLMDIYAGSNFSGAPRNFISMGSNTYFFAQNSGSLAYPKLHRTDGTVAGTAVVSGALDVTGLDFVMGNNLYFFVNNSPNDRLYRTDGFSTPVYVTQLSGSAGASVVDNVPNNHIVINNVLYFVASDSDLGSELWRTDGTASGTFMLKNIASSFNSSEPRDFVNLNGVLYFTADDYINGRELWKSDGTTAGTVMLKDIYTGAIASNPKELVVSDGKIYFSAFHPTFGRELWVSDGTSAGTTISIDLEPGVSSSSPLHLTSGLGRLWFSAATSSYGRELWKKVNNTSPEMVTDLFPGSPSSNPSNLEVIDGELYFGATNGTNGAEPYKTLGSACSTFSLGDLSPGDVGSYPEFIAKVNNKILLIATTPFYGRELMSFDAPQQIINDVSGCYSYIWSATGDTLYNPGVYSTIVPDQLGCDSLIFINLTINYPVTVVDNQTACESFVWMDGITYTSSINTPVYVASAANGCDTTYLLHLTITHPSVPYTLNHMICSSFTWGFNGQTYTSSGQYTDTILTSGGCDSIATLNLTIINASVGVDLQTACDSFTWIDGNTYHSSTNTPTFVLQNAEGCDSIVTLNLTITNSTMVTDVQTACGPYTWIDGHTYAVSTNAPTFLLQNAAGCDSIITLNLTVSHPNAVTDVQTACDSLVWIDGNTYTSSTSTPTVLLQNASGCDSTVTLNLTITHTNAATDVRTECDSYDWIDGNTYVTSTNIPTFVLQNAAGCDSIVTLNLTILNSSTGTDIQTACDSFTWIDGITYYSSTNTPTFVLQNAVGCDSLVTLNLTILSTSGQDLQTACDSLIWMDGNSYYSSTNTPTFVLQNTAGCDSIVTLNLTITHSTSGTDIQTVCDSYDWIDGNTYTSSTSTPTFVLQNASGCDSTITLNLTVIPSLPLAVENVFVFPSDANSCAGEAAIDLSGNADFELDFDNGSQIITSNGYSLVTNLCPGVHDLHVTDNCGDTLSIPVVIPIDSNYVFNNPFIDSLAQDSLGATMTNCDIYYAGIDTAYIDSIWANGNTVNVIWNIVDSNGSNFDTTSYVLNNGNGVYWLQLSVFCPNKSLGEYFTVSEAIYFQNGHVSTAGLEDYGKNLFEIYPNPTNDQVHISFSGSEAELTVYDLQGKVVLKDRIQNQGIVSLQNFERGVYLFDFKNSQGQSVQRVVKQ